MGWQALRLRTVEIASLEDVFLDGMSYSTVRTVINVVAVGAYASNTHTQVS